MFVETIEEMMSGLGFGLRFIYLIFIFSWLVKRFFPFKRRRFLKTKVMINAKIIAKYAAFKMNEEGMVGTLLFMLERTYDAIVIFAIPPIIIRVLLNFSELLANPYGLTLCVPICIGLLTYSGVLLVRRIKSLFSAQAKNIIGEYKMFRLKRGRLT